MRKGIPTLLLAVLTASAVSGCSSKVTAPAGGPARPPESSVPAAPSQEPGVTRIGETIDLDAESAVSEGCVAAWRKCLAGDEPAAMKQLQELNERYPKAITVRFMMGQVEDRAGKHQEAIKYYREAVTKSGFNSMYTWKLAESLRTTGDAKAAIPRYRSLLENNPDFTPGRLGLARALYAVDHKSAEARQQLQAVLDQEPGNKEARSFLTEIGPAK